MKKSQKILELITILIDKKLDKLLKSKKINEIIDSRVKKIIKEQLIVVQTPQINENNITKKSNNIRTKNTNISTKTDIDINKIKNKTYSKNKSLDEILRNTAVTLARSSDSEINLNNDESIQTIRAGEHEIPVPDHLKEVFNRDYRDKLKKMEESAKLTRPTGDMSFIKKVDIMKADIPEETRKDEK